jgi:hypothetical protein
LIVFVDDRGLNYLGLEIINSVGILSRTPGALELSPPKAAMLLLLLWFKAARTLIALISAIKNSEI